MADMSSHRRVTACAHPTRPSDRTGRVPRTGRTAAAVLAAGASLALVAGCASATTGSTANGAGAAAPAAATSSAAAPSLAGLAARVATAVAGARSVHLAGDLSNVSVLPVKVGAVEGDVALAGGKPTAADVTAGSFGLRYVDGSAWVDLPGDAAKPWTALSPDSANPLVAAAATKLAGLQTSLAGIDPTALLGAASDLREAGPDDVDGTAATRYTFTVDATKLAAALGVDDDGGRAATVGSVPVQVWLDGSDLPVRITATPSVDGTASPVTFTLSAWNQPVTISAPDPSTVTG